MHFSKAMLYLQFDRDMCNERNVVAVLVVAVLVVAVVAVVSQAAELLVHHNHGNEHNHCGGGWQSHATLFVCFAF